MINKNTNSNFIMKTLNDHGWEAQGIAARQAVNEMFASDLAIYINDNREITFQKSEGEILDLEEISNEDQEEDLNTNDIGD